jgi:hypothetical protein
LIAVLVEVVIYLVAVVVIAGLGIWIGMIIAPRIGRLMAPPDEDQDGDD